MENVNEYSRHTLNILNGKFLLKNYVLNELEFVIFNFFKK